MVSTIKAIIVDDEFLARKRVSNLLNDIKEIEVIDEYSSGKEAINKINTVKPDLLFLDIKITDMTGFEILKEIDQNTMPLVIFITAYDEFALKAFDFFAFDYLLKPFKDERFLQSTKRVIELFQTNKSKGIDRKISNLLKYIENPDQEFLEVRQTKLAIKANGKISFINKDDIKYILASGYYAEIFTEQKKYVLRESLNSLFHQLKSFQFERIHRSTIINTSLIKEVLYSNYGEIDVKMQDDKLFRISKTYKKEFQKKMGI
ncbi:LytR/AlgR family response regulator transcription factor [Aestuariivivens sediminicola]|uniref:LytR/AlgR family response regulator transcription factor n=1 Tax=Aestuariivivens sediminicola TaxID=2913560 RepID=UPI001F55F507|nr:LytTR family DNA-binding domain-containing protein [Aestuariivivens sediminicola]